MKTVEIEAIVESVMKRPEMKDTDPTQVEEIVHIVEEFCPCILFSVLLTDSIVSLIAVKGRIVPDDLIRLVKLPMIRDSSSMNGT